MVHEFCRLLQTDVHYMTCKIAIIGPGSTGKTFLAAKLAYHYQCLWVPEYAWEYLHQLRFHYSAYDIEMIARGQIEYEDLLASRSTKMLICDTNLLVIKIWMEHVYDTCPQWINNEIINRKYDMHLLMYPDIPYVHDPLYEYPDNRKYLFEKYERLICSLQIPYVVISGTYHQRINQAISVIDKLKEQRYVPE
jgi:NadR type nicotinamide-nucleotide adenylyltransferase